MSRDIRAPIPLSAQQIEQLRSVSWEGLPISRKRMRKTIHARNSSRISPQPG